MEPLPGWAERLAEAARRPASAPERRLVLPKAADYYAGRTTTVATAGDAEALAQLAAQRPLSHIGFDTEFKYDAAGVIIDADHTWYDPRSVHPLLLSLALAEPDGDGDSLLSSFVVDLRQPEVLPARRPVPAADPLRGPLRPRRAALPAAARVTRTQDSLGFLGL